jgi:hypothetical protein
MENVFLIVGLGNPGAEYAKTRHNAGFLLVEKLAAQWKTDWTNERKFKARIAKSERNGKRVLLCEPQTFMNLSGESVGELMKFYQLLLAQLIVAVDDADLQFGEIVDITVWSPSNSIWHRANLRDCGSGSGAKTVRGRSPIMFSADLKRMRTRCWKKFWNGRPIRLIAGWRRDCKRR